MKSCQSAFILSCGFLLVILLILGTLFYYASGLNHDKKGLIKNYENKKVQIEEARLYFKSILPPDTHVHIEFKKNGNISSFRADNDSISWGGPARQLTAERVDSILNDLDWTHNNILNLKKILNNANAISISGKKHVNIGWKRSGMGKYSYLLFDSPLSDSLISDYNDGCYYIYYKENVVLQYGGGVFGPQCFPD